MTENTETITDPVTSPATAARRIPKRRSVVAATAVMAVLGIGVAGAVLHHVGVNQGKEASARVAMTEMQALQARGDARVAAAERETRIPEFMRASAGVKAAENRLFGWSDEATKCRFIRTPEGRIFWDISSMDLREVLDALPTQSCEQPAPVLDAGRRVGDACLTTVKVGGATWVLPDDRGGAMRRATAEERDALSEHAACGGVTIPN